MHSDFIHTVAGEPLYFETTDNFADLRERFFEVVQRCRQVMKWPSRAGAELCGGSGVFSGKRFSSRCWPIRRCI